MKRAVVSDYLKSQFTGKEVDTPLMVGFATSRETAQIDGDSALFRLPSAG
jgi:hypothetical protein